MIAIIIYIVTPALSQVVYNNASSWKISMASVGKGLGTKLGYTVIIKEP